MDNVCMGCVTAEKRQPISVPDSNDHNDTNVVFNYATTCMSRAVHLMTGKSFLCPGQSYEHHEQCGRAVVETFSTG